MNTLLNIEFGFKDIVIKKLNGYENLNYLVETSSKKYVFKTYGYSDELLAIIEAENDILFFLHDCNPNKFPKPIPFLDGSYIKVLKIDDLTLICRMLSYLTGNLLDDIKHTKNVFQSFGTFLAQMDIKLLSFNSTTIKERQSEWNTENFSLNKKYIRDIPIVKDQNIVHYFFQQYEKQVVPLISKLRKSIIHNDANQWNVLVKEKEIFGIIDFGDLAYSQLINELAIAIAYACQDKENPLKWSLIILKSYHKILQIEEIETQVLYYLIAARLCISVCNAAHSKLINPNNEYAFASEKSAWKMLDRWITINPLTAENSFRSAIDLPEKNLI